MRINMASKKTELEERIAEDIRQMKALGVDQITTNKPALVREILWER